MRNLRTYPPTTEEVVSALRKLAEEIHTTPAGEGPVGDMRPFLLELAALTVEKHGIEWKL